MQKLLLGIIVLLFGGFGVLTTPGGASADYVHSSGNNYANASFTFAPPHRPFVDHLAVMAEHIYNVDESTVVWVSFQQTKDDRIVRNLYGWAYLPPDAFSQDGVASAELSTTLDLCLVGVRSDGVKQGCQAVSLSITWVSNGFPTYQSSYWTNPDDGCQEEGSSDSGYSTAVATATISLAPGEPITSYWADLGYSSTTIAYTGDGCTQP